MAKKTSFNFTFSLKTLIIILLLLLTLYGFYKHNKIIDRKCKYLENMLKDKNNYLNKLQTLEKNNTQLNNINNYLHLFDKYYNGISDKYDRQGNKIKGISPQPLKAIDIMQKAISLGYNPGYLDIAKMYHHGIYNLKPDFKKAKYYYQLCIKNNNNKIKNDSIKGLNDCVQEEETINTYKWLNLKMPNKHAKSPKFSSISNTNSERDLENSLYIDNLDELPIIYPPVREFNAGAYIGNRGTFDNIEAIPLHKINDTQNVHDHAVISTIKQSLDSLQKNTSSKDNKISNLKDIRQYLSSQNNCDKKNDALMALDVIEKNDTPLSFTELTESDTLNLIWNRINQKNSNESKNLKENLYNELSECIEHDLPVCSVGRLTHIVDTLNLADPDVTIKPTAALSQEMLSKASQVRANMEDKLSQSEKKMLNSNDDNDFQTDFNKELKSNIMDALHKDYVETDLITPDKFNSEINNWIDYV